MADRRIGALLCELWGLSMEKIDIVEEVAH